MVISSAKASMNYAALDGSSGHLSMQQDFFLLSFQWLQTLQLHRRLVRGLHTHKEKSDDDTNVSETCTDSSLHRQKSKWHNKVMYTTV